MRQGVTCMSPIRSAATEAGSSRPGEQRKMSKTTTTARMRRDGTVVEVLADGSERPFPEAPMRPMTEKEVEAAAWADPDARPFTPEEQAKAKRVPRIKT